MVKCVAHEQLGNLLRGDGRRLLDYLQVLDLLTEDASRLLTIELVPQAV